MAHAKKAAQFIKDEPRTDWHNQSLWFLREKRDRTVHQIKDWEQLRNMASAIKNDVLAHLDEYLIQFEKMAKQNGVQVHWAADAHAHNEIRARLVK